jgi:hypothetical protein
VHCHSLQQSATWSLGCAHLSDYGVGLTPRSGTHECRPKALHQPETLEELESLVADYHKRGESDAYTLELSPGTHHTVNARL